MFVRSRNRYLSSAGRSYGSGSRHRTARHGNHNRHYRPHPARQRVSRAQSFAVGFADRSIAIRRPVTCSLRDADCHSVTDSVSYSDRHAIADAIGNQDCHPVAD